MCRPNYLGDHNTVRQISLIAQHRANGSIKVWGWSSAAMSFVRRVTDLHHSICRATGPGILLQKQMRQFSSDRERTSAGCAVPKEITATTLRAVATIAIVTQFLAPGPPTTKPMKLVTMPRCGTR